MNDQNTNNKQETEVKILVDTTEKVEQHEENGETPEVKVSAVEEAETEAEVFKHLIEEVEKELKNFSANLKAQKSDLAPELEKLKKGAILIHNVPKKLEEQIHGLIPGIATELNTINERQLEKIEQHYVRQTEESVQRHIEQIRKIEQYYAEQTEDQKNSLMESRQKIEQLAIDISKIDKRRIINLFIGVIISSVIAACGATYAASYMMKSFPTRVAIQHPENIILYDSNVSLWDLSETNAKLNDTHKKFNKLKEDLGKIKKQIQNKDLRKNNTKDSSKP